MFARVDLNKEKMMTIDFKNFFKLKQDEDKLGFVNIPLNTDVELYIDPLVLRNQKGAWFAEANNLIVDFFEEVLLAIRNNDDNRALYLLGRLREPNATHFGVSSNMPDGCGIGDEQALILLKKLKKSKAVATGHLKDLSDCELLIPGIGSDKISDIVTNIIRGMLIEYTEEECKRLQIPVQETRSGFFWSQETKQWIRRKALLPHFHNKPVILVPKNIVRKRTSSNYRNFYERIIEALQDYHLTLNTSLVKVLKNGKRIVSKKSLKEIHKCNKDFIFTYVDENPKFLEKYKRTRY